MKLVPISEHDATLLKDWLEQDSVGKKEMGAYEDVHAWLKLIDNSSRWGWILYENKLPIGFIDLEIKQITGFFSFYIESSQREKGKSQLLLETLVKKAKMLHVSEIEAGVNKKNKPSLKALRKFGFLKRGEDSDNYERLVYLIPH